MSISWNLSSFSALAGLFAVFPCIWDMAAGVEDGQPQTGTRLIHKTEDTVCTFPFCDISPHFPAAGLTLNFYFIFSSHFTVSCSPWVCIDPNGRVGTFLLLKAIKMGDSPSAVAFFSFVKCLLSFQCLLSSSGSHRPVDSSFVVVRSKNVSQMRTVQILPKMKPSPTFCRSSVTHLSSIIQEPIAGLYFMHLYFSCPEACTQYVIPVLDSVGLTWELVRNADSPKLLNENMYYNNTPGDS